MLNTKADVVFVGAGPTGLWTAVQTKLRNPQIQIDFLEKHEDYQRSHVLKINPNSLRGLPKDPRIQKIVQEFTQNRFPRTNGIQGNLTTLAQELGIGIHKFEVTDPQALRQKYPHAKVIVGSDGAHSIVRKKIFNEEMSVLSDLKFVVEVKYEVVGKGIPLRFVKEAYPLSKTMGILAQEYVGSEKEGKTPVTLRMFLDKEKYEAMKGATFKDPYTFENEELIDKQVMSNMQTWLNVKAKKGEVRIPGSEKITVTRLGIYASKEVIKTENGITWCLLGDAAFGVPFFRSLNNGFLAGTKLSKSISRELHPNPKIPKSFQSSFSSYSLYVKSLAKRETLIARIKSLFLSILLWFVQISARVPWQVNYWTEARTRQLQPA